MAFPTTVDPIANGSVIQASWLLGPQRITVGPTMYNVKSDQWGAKGDGSTDDAIALQSVLDTCRTAGGGRVFAPPGTYMLGTASRTGGFGGIMNGTNTHLHGAGVESTIFKLRNSQSGTNGSGSQTAAIIGMVASNQERISYSDFTIDGNAVNQSDRINGLLILSARGVQVQRVRVKDVSGTTNAGGLNETALFWSQLSSDVTFINCDAVQTGSTTSSDAFSAGTSTSVVFDSCRAIGIGNSGSSLGFGFTTADGREILFNNCHAYLCGGQGFHVDNANAANITHIGCISGGLATATASYPFSAGQSLGNTFGYVCTVACPSVKYIGCVADNNSSNGFDLRAGTFVVDGCSSRNNGGSGFRYSNTPIVRMNGGHAEGNVVGVNIIAVADAPTIRITGGPRLNGNTNNLQIAGTNYAAPPTNVAAPAVPASTVVQNNPFGWDATVHVAGGTVTVVAVNGVATGLIAGTFRVPAGGTITLTYTVAPTWTWYLE